MKDHNGYAVYFFPQALEALGEAAKAYLHDGKAGPHILCREIDTGGALVEMTLAGHTEQGQAVDIELMVPTSMVRMVVSARGDEAFGFGPRIAPVDEGVPVVAADAAAASGLGVAAKKPAGEEADSKKKGAGARKPAAKAPAGKGAKARAGKTAGRTGAKSAAGKARKKTAK
ncbi:hypothetical protein [Lysobacter sp. A3-1-A15]|uniref:hypothetical protein n=1 Tax=Novilysobacter viscosus TaxID=3098602 RepID=UPI002EDAAAD4